MTIHLPRGFYQRQRSPRRVARDIGIVAVIVLVAAALLVLSVFVLVWSINDIAAHGANFWNVVWLVVVSLGLIGGVAQVRVEGGR